MTGHGKLRGRLPQFPIAVWLLALSNFVLFGARGMTVPFLVIYFGQIVGLGEGTVGAGIAVNAVAGIVLTLLLGGTIDRFGARRVLLLTIIGTAITTALHPWATTVGLFFVLMILHGFVSQLYWPASDALATSLVPVSRAGEMFALLRVANAIGIGAGGLVGGLIVTGGSLAAYRVLYISAGLGIAAAAVMILALVRPPARQTAGTLDSQASDPSSGSWREVLADRRFMLSQAVMFVLLCAFTQLQVSAPPYLRAEAGLSEAAIGLLFTINTVVVVIGQIAVARRIADWRRGATLAVAALFWIVAYALIGISPWIGALPFVAIVVYTLGEMCFMPTSGVLVVELAPERLRGRYLAFSSVIWGGAWGLASWLAGVILGSERPALLWPALIGVLLVGIAGALAFDRFATKTTEAPRAWTSHADD